MNYILNVEVAVKYGVDEAIMLENIVFWIRKNQANNKHFYDGEYWTYNSVKAFSELFPFWSERQIDRILKSLEKQNAIIVGNYNKRGYDRTKWYAITSTVKSIYRIGEYSISLNGKMSDNANSPNGEMEFTKWGNGIHQTVKPIPNINTDINTDINTTQQVVSSKNIDYIETYTHLKLSNNMKNEVTKWDYDRLEIAVNIFNSESGKYFSLLKKIYNDDGNFAKKNNKQEIDPKSFNNFEARDYDYDDLEERLLGWK